MDAGVRTSEIAGTFGFSQRCDQKTIQRYNIIGSTTLRPHTGRPSTMSERD